MVTLSETVLETTREILEVSHATSSGGLASNGLLAPVIYKIRLNPCSTPYSQRTLAHLRSGEGAGSTSLLLLVEGAVTTALAERVTLGMALTTASSTLSLRKC
jgi:hypothetical protein